MLFEGAPGRVVSVDPETTLVTVLFQQGNLTREWHVSPDSIKPRRSTRQVCGTVPTVPVQEQEVPRGINRSMFHPGQRVSSAITLEADSTHTETSATNTNPATCMLFEGAPGRVVSVDPETTLVTVLFQQGNLTREWHVSPDSIKPRRSTRQVCGTVAVPVQEQALKPVQEAAGGINRSKFHPGQSVSSVVHIEADGTRTECTFSYWSSTNERPKYYIYKDTPGKVVSVGETHVTVEFLQYGETNEWHVYPGSIN